VQVSTYSQHIFAPLIGFRPVTHFAAKGARTAGNVGADRMSIAEQIQTLLSKLYEQGSLDEEQFSQLQMLQDESNEGFLAEIITLYLEDTEAKLRSVREMLATQKVDHTELDSIFHQLKGSSSSVGASEVAKLCVECRDLSLTKGPVEVAAAVEHILQTFEDLKTHFQQLLRLQSQLAAQS
jgi:histidine-containing phosphotransfer protein